MSYVLLKCYSYVVKTTMKLTLFMVKLILLLMAYALAPPFIGFALRSVQTRILMRNCFEMCVYTLLKANRMDMRVRVYTLKGTSNSYKTLSISAYLKRPKAWSKIL